MMGFKVKTKKAAKELIGKDVRSYFDETSLFGLEYSPSGKFTVCISLNCRMVRNVFGTMTVVNNILTKVE